MKPSPMSPLARSVLRWATAIVAIGFSITTAAEAQVTQVARRVKASVVVGPTVHISKDFSDQPHYENLAAGDLNHPGRLIACGELFPKNLYEWVIHQYCYVTFDGGKTWEATLKSIEGWGNQDPAATYGKGDDVYVVSLVGTKDSVPYVPKPDAPPQKSMFTVVYKSSDGGKTWAESSRFEFIDREFINVDLTNGPYSGRVYVVGQGGISDLSGGGYASSLKMWRSLDGGKTFLGPAAVAYPTGEHIAGVGTGAVLSDGTVVGVFGLTKAGRSQSLEDHWKGPNGEIHVFTSRDGGETFDPSHKVADWTFDRSRSEGGMLGQLAADPGSAAFKDRIYVVYPEIIDNRIQIRLAYSADKAKTWSGAVTVNDDRGPESQGNGPDHLLPGVGVNKDGVVLVSWYDRRETGDNLGWRLRAAVSYDGGETFSSSFPITETSTNYTIGTPWDISANGSGSGFGVSTEVFFNSAGHTSGLAVDADGTFHPTWVSNHTGVFQYYTTSIKVDGKVVKNGSEELAQLEDISGSLRMEMAQPILDRSKGTVTVTFRLRNTSTDTLEGPIKMRILDIHSRLGSAELSTSDNGETGTGAIIDFTPLLGGKPLAPGERSSERSIVIRISDLRPLVGGKEYDGQLFSVSAKTFGKKKAKSAEKSQ